DDVGDEHAHHAPPRKLLREMLKGTPHGRHCGHRVAQKKSAGCSVSARFQDRSHGRQATTPAVGSCGYSDRRATIGSTRAARRAGSQQASAETKARSSTMAAKMPGSPG